MKKSMLLFFSILCFSSTYTQNDALIGVDGSLKYIARQQVLKGSSYQGAGSYDVGITFMQRIGRSAVYWQTGINFNRFSERLIRFVTPTSKQKTIFKRHALSIPIGVKFFLSDRKCDLFIKPSISFDYYFNEKISVFESINIFNQEISSVVEHPIGDHDSFVTTAQLAIGGHQPINKKIDVLIQLEGTYGLFGTGAFQQNQPWSVGIRSGIFYKL